MSECHRRSESRVVASSSTAIEASQIILELEVVYYMAQVMKPKFSGSNLLEKPSIQKSMIWVTFDAIILLPFLCSMAQNKWIYKIHSECPKLKFNFLSSLRAIWPESSSKMSYELSTTVAVIISIIGKETLPFLAVYGPTASIPWPSPSLLPLNFIWTAS